MKLFSKAGEKNSPQHPAKPELTWELAKLQTVRITTEAIRIDKAVLQQIAHCGKQTLLRNDPTMAWSGTLQPLPDASYLYRALKDAHSPLGHSGFDLLPSDLL
jgi:hypothetical protein